MDTTEVRTTNEKTGGQKGSKLQRFASMPTKAILELAEHYGKGVTKYPDTGVGPNYSRGYDWHLSYEATMRHLTQFWAGEDLDPETGSKHVIAAAWHCLALALFMDTHPELDDRWEKKIDHGILEDLGPHTGKTIEARRFESYDPIRSRED